MAKAPPTLIFDLDGTLVDTAPDLLGALNAVLKAQGRKLLTLEQVRHMVGHGARALIDQAMRDAGVLMANETSEQLVEHFLAYYREHIADESVAFPGVIETLVDLGQSGAKLGVCTNKHHELTEALLTKMDLGRYFGAVLGAGKMPYNKPDPRHITDVVEMLGGDLQRSVMIGDSATDVGAARAADIPVIVMSYGYTPVPPHQLGANLVLDDFADIPAAVERLLG